MPANSRYSNETRNAFRKRMRGKSKFKRPIKRGPRTPPPGFAKSPAKGGTPPGQAKKSNLGVSGNRKFRGTIGLGDLRRAVKRRDKTTVTRAEAKKSFLASAKTALAPTTATTGTGTETKPGARLGAKLAKKDLGLVGQMKKRKGKKNRLGSVS